MSLSRSWSRALALADEVVLAGVFKQESIPVAERLHPEAVVRALVAQGRRATLAANVEADRDACGRRSARGRCGGDPFEWRLRWHL